MSRKIHLIGYMFGQQGTLYPLIRVGVVDIYIARESTSMWPGATNYTPMWQRASLCRWRILVPILKGYYCLFRQIQAETDQHIG
jgi:hypothetical protein